MATIFPVLAKTEQIWQKGPRGKSTPATIKKPLAKSGGQLCEGAGFLNTGFQVPLASRIYQNTPTYHRPNG